MEGVRWAARTDRGLVRPRNEDAFVAALPVFVVADGMGGHSGGDVASHIAAELFTALSRFHTLGVDDVYRTIEEVNSAIVESSNHDPSLREMGTTLTGLALITAAGSAHWMAFNVGDSRVYRFADRRLEQLTVDHSEAEELVAAGTISRDESRVDPRRHVVTRVLGTAPAPDADAWVFPPTPGERFLICSDGLTSEIDDGEIMRILEAWREPADAATALVDASLRAGGSDNVTVLIVDWIPVREVGEVDPNTSPRVDCD